MSINKLIGLLIILLGAAVSILSITADALGLSAQPGVIGWKQQAASNAGIFIAMVGLWFSQLTPNGGNNKPK